MAVADTRVAEALKLYLVDGLPIRVIAKKLSMSRNTVRRLVRIPRKPITDSAVKPIGHSTRSRSPEPE